MIRSLMNVLLGCRTQGWSAAVSDQDVSTVQDALAAVIRLINMHPALLDDFIQDPGASHAHLGHIHRALALQALPHFSGDMSNFGSGHAHSGAVTVTLALVSTPSGSPGGCLSIQPRDLG